MSGGMFYEPLEANEECTVCGADIGPSSTFPWHFEDEDCRAVRDPLEAPTLIVRAAPVTVSVNRID